MGRFSTAFQSIKKEVSELPTDRLTLRRFGILIGSILVGITGIWAWKNGWGPGWKGWIPGGVGALLIGVGLARPAALRRVYGVWMLMATILGFIMTRVILTIVFYLLVTPTGLVMRLFRHDPMKRRPDPSQPTYWIRRAESDNDRSRMERYF